MLYDEKIEALISAALADGVLTEKEKQILFKKAQDQGIDLDEFEMVLDARLVELEKAEKEKAAASAPKSTKFGDVRKCPVCGALVPALAVSCPECGYEFSGIEADSASQQLAKQIDDILKEAIEQKNNVQRSRLDNSFKLTTSSPLETALHDIDKNTNQRVKETIKNFPIPNTKSNLFEFMVSLQSKSKQKVTSWQTNYKEAYDTKLQEAYNKAKLLFPSDPMFEKIFKELEAENNKKKIKKIIKAIIWTIVILIILYLAVI